MLAIQLHPSALEGWWDTLKFNRFGLQNERISALGLGCSRIGSFNNPASPKDIRRTLDRALDLGINVFDTADIYGQGDSERTLGSFLKHKRNKAFVVSKVGKRFSLKMRLARPLKPLLRPLIRQSGSARAAITERRTDHIGSNFRPAYLALAIERSLKRLRFDTLDAVLLHSPMASDLVDREIETVLGRMKHAGKIRHYGISCDDLPSLRQALTFDSISLLELPFDLIEAVRQTDDWSEIAKRRIGVLAREVIRFQPGRSPSAAISHSLADRNVTCAVAGTSRSAHLDELAAALA